MGTFRLYPVLASKKGIIWYEFGISALRFISSSSSRVDQDASACGMYTVDRSRYDCNMDTTSNKNTPIRYENVETIRDYIIRNGGEGLLLAYLDRCREDTHMNPDYLMMRECILLKGMSPRAASIETAKFIGRDNFRVEETLRHHMNDVVRDIVYHLIDISEIFKELKEKGYIILPISLAFIVREAMQEDDGTLTGGDRCVESVAFHLVRENG